MCGAGKDRAKNEGDFHESHSVWKGWSEEGVPPTNVCVRCGCFATFKAVNLKKACKGTFVSEGARRNVGTGRHPLRGLLLKGWQKVGMGGCLMGVTKGNSKESPDMLGLEGVGWEEEGECGR